MKVPFTLASGGINCLCEIFRDLCLGNAHGRKNLLSFLALRIRGYSLLFVPAQGGGMEIFMDSNVVLIRKQIKEKFKTIENFANYMGIPRTTINFILKNGVGSSNYNMVTKIFKALEITPIENNAILTNAQSMALLEKYTALDDIGRHTVDSVADAEYKRVSEIQSDRAIIAAYGGITTETPLTDEEKRILSLLNKIKESEN